LELFRKQSDFWSGVNNKPLNTLAWAMFAITMLKSLLTWVAAVAAWAIVNPIIWLPDVSFADVNRLWLAYTILSLVITFKITLNGEK